MGDQSVLLRFLIRRRGMVTTTFCQLLLLILAPTLPGFGAF